MTANLELLSVEEARLLWPNMVPQVKLALDRNGNMSEALR